MQLNTDDLDPIEGELKLIARGYDSHVFEHKGKPDILVKYYADMAQDILRSYHHIHEKYARLGELTTEVVIHEQTLSLDVQILDLNGLHLYELDTGNYVVVPRVYGTPLTTLEKDVVIQITQAIQNLLAQHGIPLYSKEAPGHAIVPENIMILEQSTEKISCCITDIGGRIEESVAAEQALKKD